MVVICGMLPVLVMVVALVMVELERAIFLTIIARSHSDNSDDDDEAIVTADESRLPPRLTGVWLWLLFIRRTKPSTRSSTYSSGRNGWYLRHHNDEAASNNNSKRRCVSSAIVEE